MSVDLDLPMIIVCLDNQTGIPTSGVNSSIYNFTAPHNYNLVLFTQLFPQAAAANFGNGKTHEKGMNGLKQYGDRKKEMSLDNLGR